MNTKRTPYNFTHSTPVKIRKIFYFAALFQLSSWFVFSDFLNGLNELDREFYAILYLIWAGLVFVGMLLLFFKFKKDK